MKRMVTVEGILYKVEASVINFCIMDIKTKNLVVSYRSGSDIQQEDATRYYPLLGKRVQLKVDSKRTVREIKEVNNNG